MIHELTLATLKDQLEGGRVGAAFDLELKRCIDDCVDRPGDSNARKVTIELAIVPVLGDGGFCDEARGVLKVTSSVPKRKTKPISFGIRKSKGGHQLVFNDLSEDDINQRTID